MINIRKLAKIERLIGNWPVNLTVKWGEEISFDLDVSEQSPDGRLQVKRFTVSREAGLQNVKEGSKLHKAMAELIGIWPGQKF